MSAETMPRLVCLNPWDQHIGPNRYLVELLRASPALARQTTIVLPADDSAADEYRAIGCAVEIWDAARLVHINARPANLWRLFSAHTLGIWRAYHRLRTLRAQIVLTNSENVWLGGIAARMLGIPHLQVFHALTLEYNWGKRPWLVRTYLHWLSLWSHRLIAVSPAVAQMLMRHHIAEEHIALVPNALNVPAIVAASQCPVPPSVEALLRAHSPILISFGRISRVKGHDLLIEAFTHVHAKFPNAGLLCAGELLSDQGVDDTVSFYRHLQQRLEDLNLTQSVHFLGELDNALALLPRADVYIQPSRTESFCRAVAEAAILRVPVVAFKVGGIPDVLSEEGGVLVPPENPAVLSEAILRVLNDTALRAHIVQSAHRRVTELYDVQHVAPRWVELVTAQVYHRCS
jgi:glycosyltransferase involved in cell wall biosynthesis